MGQSNPTIKKTHRVLEEHCVICRDKLWHWLHNSCLNGCGSPCLHSPSACHILCTQLRLDTKKTKKKTSNDTQNNSTRMLHHCVKAERATHWGESKGSRKKSITWWPSNTLWSMDLWLQCIMLHIVQAVIGAKIVSRQLRQWKPPCVMAKDCWKTVSCKIIHWCISPGTHLWFTDNKQNHWVYGCRLHETLRCWNTKRDNNSQGIHGSRHIYIQALWARHKNFLL